MSDPHGPTPYPRKRVWRPPPQDPCGGVDRLACGGGGGRDPIPTKDRNTSILCIVYPFTDGTHLLQGLECIKPAVRRVITNYPSRSSDLSLNER